MGDGSTRFASRVLLYDPDGRVLLFLDEFPDLPGRAKWITPGGGVEPGETAHEAAVRELYEETGLAVDDLGTIVHSLEFPVSRPAARHSFSHWDFFVHAVEAPFEPSRANWTEDERRDVQDVRWWDIDELVASGQGFAPRELPSLVRRFRP